MCFWDNVPSPNDVNDYDLRYEVNSEIGFQLHASDNPVALGKKRGSPLKKGDKDWQDATRFEPTTT